MIIALSSVYTQPITLTSSLSATDVQRALPELTTGPAADAEGAPDRHQRPAAGEFCSSITYGVQSKVESECFF